ncbi:nucleoside-diphosphate kinase [Vibrio sp. PNB22_3_1]
MSKHTLAIIKPEILFFEQASEVINAIRNHPSLRIIDAKTTQLSQQEVVAFYSEHADQPWFCELIEYMSSGEIIVLKIQGSNAIQDMIELCGPTNPSLAPKNTIRGMFGTDIQHNAIHRSDSETSAEREIRFFFPTNQPI